MRANLAREVGADYSFVRLARLLCGPGFASWDVVAMFTSRTSVVILFGPIPEAVSAVREAKNGFQDNLTLPICDTYPFVLCFSCVARMDMIPPGRFLCISMTYLGVRVHVSAFLACGPCESGR